MTLTTRKMSNRHEQDICGMLGGRVTKNSGATWAETMDVLMDEGDWYSFALDGKSTLAKSMSFTREMWTKALKQSGMRLTAMPVTIEAILKGVADKRAEAFQLAPLTGKGGDRWVTKAGASWTLAHGKVASTSDRPVKILSYGFAADGYHDLVVWKGLQISVINHGALAPQRRTRHLPVTATLLGMTADRFVAATPEGLWTVPIEPTNGPGPVPTR